MCDHFQIEFPAAVLETDVRDAESLTLGSATLLIFFVWVLGAWIKPDQRKWLYICHFALTTLICFLQSSSEATSHWSVYAPLWGNFAAYITICVFKIHIPLQGLWEDIEDEWV